MLAWLVRGERLRHHAGALAAGGVDFGVMIALVEIAGVHPVAATALGALCGALTNFLLGRSWVFRRADAKATGQALRYALVSSASLALNTLGEHLAIRSGLGYLRARLLVAVLVSVLWNYPMHKFFVFRTQSRSR